MTLEIIDLTVKYRERAAVSDISWRLDPGFHALLGPNGAGKSSLMRTIATLQHPTHGQIRLNGSSGNALRGNLGYCPQENLGKSRFSVSEHLAYMCWLRRIPSNDTPREVLRILELIDLADRANERVAALSGGMRRRVGIGSALVGDPDLVILDEPSAGLDVAQRQALSEILARVSAGAITIVSTHIVEDVLDHADTLTVMDRGKFLFAGPFGDFSRHRHLDEVRSRYLQMVQP